MYPHTLTYITLALTGGIQSGFILEKVGRTVRPGGMAADISLLFGRYGVPPSLTLGKEHFGPRGAFPWGRRQQEYQPAPTLWVFPNDSAHIRLCVLLILWEYSRPLNKAVARGTGSPSAPHAVENNF